MGVWDSEPYINICAYCVNYKWVDMHICREMKWLCDIFSPCVWEWWGAANVRTKWSGRLARIWNGDTLTANQSRAERSRDLLYTYITDWIHYSSHSSSRQEPDVSMTDGGGDGVMTSTLVIIVTAAGKFHRHYHHCIGLFVICYWSWF